MSDPVNEQQDPEVGGEDPEVDQTESEGVTDSDATDTTGGDDFASDGVTEDNEDVSPSKAIGLMPLTSKNFDE